MNNHFSLQIIIPSGIIYQDERVLSLVGWGEEGELAVLPGHTTFLTPLRISELMVRKEGRRGQLEEKVWAVAGGMLEVTKKGVSVISPAAEAKDEIEVDRADRARRRAEARLEKKEKWIDLDRARCALARAEIRLKVVTYAESEKSTQQ